MTELAASGGRRKKRARPRARGNASTRLRTTRTRLHHTHAVVDVCKHSKGLRIPYHNKADGFMAALVLTLNQLRFCELHSCQPYVVWGAFPACKYAGVRYPGRNPYFDVAHGHNAFEYYFRPICSAQALAQEAPPSLSCEQREKIHRVLPWAVRTYYYGAGASAGVRLSATLSNDTFDETWYRAQRAEGSRLVQKYLRLQPHILSRLTLLEKLLLRGDGGDHGQRPSGPVLGVHLRGTDKGKYMQTAGSGRAVAPEDYTSYVNAFLHAHGSNSSVFVATDSPSYLDQVLQTCTISMCN